ncbi:MAG TPA: ABC transporter permease [Cyclobacteriaceae bacterium]|nr:ABC transporter permease [Cyclobacteriaceae bacterium]
MLSNYFRIAFRNFFKSKVHTTINLLGLTAGMVSIFLITLYLKQELSYDKFHENAENIYRIDWYNQNPQTRTPHPMAQAMAEDFPEVVSAVSLTPLWGEGLTRETHSFRNLERDQRYDEQNILAVDTSFFNVFDFPVVKGNPKAALRNLRGVLISESAAKRYFGDEEPIGKQLAVDSDTLLVEVVAVFKDVPVNSHFHFDFLVTYLREKYLDPDDSFYSWADFGHYNYIRLAPGADAKQLEAKIMPWTKKYLGWSDEDYAGLASANYGFRLTPITDIHLRSHVNWELEPNGNISYVYILATAGLLTLLIACVNFMNLTTARSTERAKEIGVRKSLGALRRQLALQFIYESVLISMAAVVLSLIIIQIVMPIFNNLTGANLAVTLWPYGVSIFAGGLLIGLIAGVYPSLYLSGIKPSSILKGTASVSGGSTFRDVLIAFQFAISMALISGSIIIFSQLDYLQNHSLGYNQEGVLVVPLKADDFPAFDAMKNELTRIDGVTEVSATTNVPGGSFNQYPVFAVKSPTDRIDASQCYIDANFFKTMGITLKEGRLFTQGSVSDTTQTFVINEAAADQLNLENPLGAEISIDLHDRIMTGRVIGVVNNFNFQSLHDPLRPLMFQLTDEFNYMVIRGEFSNLSQKVSEIESVYRKFDPIFGFEFSFLDDRLQKQYVSESRLGVVMGLFSAIAIVIASFGLFGMALLSFYRKTKEISIRKVLGASVPHLVFILLKNFTILVLVAIVIATPFTWWVMNEWLQNFSFRIEISPMIFLGAALLLLAICWATLSYLTLKTTRLNPAETLKSE